MSDLLISGGVQRVGLATGSGNWAKDYLRRTAMSDFVIAAVCSSVATQVRFGGRLGIEDALLDRKSVV